MTASDERPLGWQTNKETDHLKTSSETEMYLEPSRTSAIELFCADSERLLAVRNLCYSNTNPIILLSSFFSKNKLIFIYFN